MIAQVVASMTFCIIIVVILIDIIPIFKDWLSRIYIGRYQDLNTWEKFIVQKGINWLNNTPKIKMTDNTRFVIIDMLRGNYTKKSIQHWQEAALILGLTEYIKNNDDEEIKREIKKFLSGKFDLSGQWIEKPKQVDAAILAYAVMKLDFLNTDSYRKAFDFIWEMIKEHIGNDGTVEYRKAMKDYRYVDTIGFICPFLVCYGIRYRNEECVDLAISQIKMYEKYGMLDGKHIPCHSYKLENKVPLGLYGWGRGLGWFAIGLIDAWNELPYDHKYKGCLEQSVRNFAKAVMEHQQDRGNWNWTVTRNECRPDSSATATLGWFILNAAKIVEISKECQESANNAIKYLMSVTKRNGEIDFSQGDTKDIGVYSMLFNILPFTQGFSIRMLSSFLAHNSTEVAKEWP